MSRVQARLSGTNKMMAKVPVTDIVEMSLVRILANPNLIKKSAS
jgi:Flp pilus assembly secretin CpaC